MKLTVAGLVLIVFFSGSAWAQAPEDYSKIYEAASPAVVTIVTDGGTGSGFLVTRFGHIATNFHVVRGARYLAVQFKDGPKVAAAIVATNELGDMALIKVNSEVVQ